MTMEEAIELALSDECPPPSASLPDRRPVPLATETPVRLTAREREVALLVARGYTNRRIAEELVLTVGTAAIHVERIRSKLGVRSRTGVAVWVVAQGWLQPG